MPLLRRKPFVRKPPPRHLQPHDSIFYCELTNEAFTDYDEYWDRLVLCNAMLWTCEITGRPNLTFIEALECEAKARKCLTNFSKPLRSPLLFLMNLTHRGRFLDASDDVFSFTRDRYFVGEEVEAIVINNKQWYDCKVTRVIYPTEEEISKYEVEMADSDIEEIDVPDGFSKFEGAVKNDELNGKAKGDEYPPYATFKYEVQEIEPWDNKVCNSYIVRWEQIRRLKNALTREKCRLYLKQCVDLNSSGFWAVKNLLVNKYKLQTVKFTDFFTGTPPSYVQGKASKVVSPKSLLQESKKGKQEDKEKKRREKKEERPEGETKKRGRPVVVDKEVKEAQKKLAKEAKEEQKLELKNEREKIKEDFKLVLEAKKEERKLATEVKRQEKRLLMQYIKEWMMPRDDLDCDNQQDLPVPTPVQCRIPNELFGAFVMVLEFANNFTLQLDIKDSYPQGITFDMLEHALVEKEITGLFNDLLQLLLQAVFDLQADEEMEVVADNTVDSKEVLSMDVCAQDLTHQEALKMANRAALWSQQYQGLPLQKVTVDALTLSEVLRLHLLASGTNIGINVMWRHMNRGGYTCSDDPGLQFKLDHPGILKALTAQSVFDLSIHDKLKIMEVLIGQVLTYASMRDTIDENICRLREAKNNLRSHQFAEGKWEKEEAAALMQKKREVKLKEKEQQMKELEKKFGLMQDPLKEGEGPPPLIDLAEEEDDEEEMEEKRALDERNRERRRNEGGKKELDLVEQVVNASRSVNLSALGEDRAYRRYWIFNSVPGLFVEDDDNNRGVCRETPTPYCTDSHPTKNQTLQQQIFLEARGHIPKSETDERANSDKENDEATPSKPATAGEKKGTLKTPNSVQPCITKFFEKVSVNVEGGAMKLEEGLVKDGEEKSSELSLPCRDLCTAEQSCPVHFPQEGQPKWKFFHRQEDFEALVSALNVRGIREMELKQSISLYRHHIENSLKTCPVFKLDPTQVPDDSTMRKSLRVTGFKKDGSANLQFPPGTPIDDIVELTLRDMILETEEKVSLGMLGAIKVQDRDAWREAIEHRTYLRLASELSWAGRKRLDKLKTEFGLETNFEADSEELSNKDITRSDAVYSLAQAILQVAQAVDPKYLQAPLGENDQIRKKRERAEEKLKRLTKNKESDSDSGSESDSSEEEITCSPLAVSDNALRTPIERWEKSLMSSTTLSQLCLHFATLENSITWARSAMKTRCRLCRRGGDAEKMLLCDECDKGHHIFCLKPPLKSIPSGDWFCEICKPKVKQRSPRKVRRTLMEVEEEEEDEDQSGSDDETCCDVCEGQINLFACCGCQRSYHAECVELRCRPKGSWKCNECKSVEQGKGKSKLFVNAVKSSKAKSKRGDDSPMESSSRRHTPRGSARASPARSTPPSARPSPQEAGSSGNGNGRGSAKEQTSTKLNRKSSSKDETPSTKTRGLGKSKEILSAKSKKTSSKKETPSSSTRKSTSRDDTPKGHVNGTQVLTSISGTRRSTPKGGTPKGPTGTRRKRNIIESEEEEEEFQPVKKMKKSVSQIEVTKSRRVERRSLPDTTPDSDDEQLLALKRILTEVTKHKDSWPFLQAVSKKEVPDYHRVVKKPMDLTTMCVKLTAGNYSSAAEFAADLRLIFDNCRQYNEDDTDEYKCAVRLSEYANKRLFAAGFSTGGGKKSTSSSSEKRRRH